MRLRYLDEFRDPATARAIVDRIGKTWDGPPVRLMEVCGTHTMAIARSGIRQLLSGRVTFLSGPGCPVCVTPAAYLDRAIALGKERGVILATFGDMVRVPGTRSSLERERGKGLDVRTVYSPLDAVALAEREEEKEVVFLGVGFETTAPAIAGAIVMAAETGVPNFSVLSSVRTIPGAMEILASDPETGIEGFLCPAHVSAIIGSDAYFPLAEKYAIPCVVAGFEPIDILLGTLMLLRQKTEGAARVENEYARVATREGNRKALGLVSRVFEECDALWRGIGVLPSTGLRIANRFSSLDAQIKFGLADFGTEEHTPCRCGDILKGKIFPPDCPLFGTTCTPAEPAGPCMVSGEGTCSAYFKYGVP